MNFGTFKKFLKICGVAPSGGLTPVSVLAATGQTTFAQSTGEVALATIIVPGGTLGPNGALRVYFKFSCENNSDDKNVAVLFGGQQVWSAGVTNGGMYESCIIIQNADSVKAQTTTRNFASFTTGFDSGTYGASQADTTQDQELVLQCTLNQAIDDFQLNGYIIEVLNP
jgi:hypothetical protein